MLRACIGEQQELMLEGQVEVRMRKRYHMKKNSADED
jgi:hypothetical protein